MASTDDLMPWPMHHLQKNLAASHFPHRLQLTRLQLEHFAEYMSSKANGA
jgi:hypothetical protein